MPPMSGPTTGVPAARARCRMPLSDARRCPSTRTSAARASDTSSSTVRWRRSAETAWAGSASSMPAHAVAVGRASDHPQAQAGVGAQRPAEGRDDGVEPLVRPQGAEVGHADGVADAVGALGEGVGDRAVGAVGDDADARPPPGEAPHDVRLGVALGDDQVRQPVGRAVDQVAGARAVVGHGVVRRDHQAARERPEGGEEDELGGRLGRLHVDDGRVAAQARRQRRPHHPQPAERPGEGDRGGARPPRQAPRGARPQVPDPGRLGDPALELVARAGGQRRRHPGPRQSVGEQEGVVADAPAAGPLHHDVVAPAAHGPTTASRSSASAAAMASQP